MIEVSHLTKRYDTVLAVDDITFSVERGRVCGLLGPNGAGKSTTMNIMTGCLAATRGEVRYDGCEIYADMNEAKRTIGYLPEQPPLYPELTAAEYLDFVARAKGLRGIEAEQAAQDAGRACGIRPVYDRLIKNLSKGYKQRIGIAQALIGNPQTVILDEPTVGLDPIQIIEIRDLIKQLGDKHTVIVSSHILSEIRALCSQIVIIAKGRIVADDAPERLERLFAGAATTTLLVRASEDELRGALSGMAHIAGLSLERAQGEAEGLIEASVDAQGDEDIREALFGALAARGVPVLEMTTRRASLEDVFVELAGGDIV